MSEEEDILFYALESIFNPRVSKRRIRKLKEFEKTPEPTNDKGVSKFLESETGKKRIKEILEYPNEKSKAELEALKDQENHEIMEAEIKAEREREGG